MSLSSAISRPTPTERHRASRMMATCRPLLLLLSAALVAGAPVKAPALKRKVEHPLVRPVAGALASCTAEAFTMPIDVAKVRLTRLPLAHLLC